MDQMSKPKKKFVARFFISAGIAFIIPGAVWGLLKPLEPKKKSAIKVSATAPTAHATYKSHNYEGKPNPIVWKTQLRMLWQDIGELAENNNSSLTKQQAQQIVNVVQRWQGKPDMSREEARQLYTQLNSLLSARQRNALPQLTAAARKHHAGLGNSHHEKTAEKAGFESIVASTNPQALENTVQLMQEITSFVASANPFYPPGAYREMKMLPGRKQQQIEANYQEHHRVLAWIQARAQ